MTKKLALTAAGTLALAGFASYAYVTLVPPADPPTMQTARAFFTPTAEPGNDDAEPSPEAPHFTKGKPSTPTHPSPDTPQPLPAHSSTEPAPSAEPGIAFRDSHKRPINFAARPQSAPTPASPSSKTPQSLLTGGGKTKPALGEGQKPTPSTTPEPTPAASVAQATPSAAQPTAQANEASPSAPKRPRAKSPFTYEEELYRAQYGWQAFAERMRAAALNPEPAVKGVGSGQ